ncbi:hypothetical protein QBC47DRAFT_447651 [Echria macrotheca]|uniref:Uncharacterized protein n=1 Tax=Echria macrotheca TaxID=438768 RepID=A0AAJ0F4I9_9PEZI|nr:hypothetical protein QBC47DRAFT_447651 [Echria macrotheca]
MVNYRFVALAGLTAALPLNINLGAYSPALVVGDGEISFGGKQDVTSLMNALEGAAVSAAANANNAPVAAAAAPAAVAAPAAPAVVESAAVDPALAQQAQQIAALQGISKEIAPRDGEEASANVEKRDLAGFDRALRYAEVALTKGPKIQLGTGAEGSGVGIIVDNNPVAAGGARAEKRDVGDAETAAPVTTPKRSVKVTTMYVRRGIPASLQGPSASEEVAAREVPLTARSGTTATAPSPSKRDDAIDAINLNVDGDAGLTMTFVETVDDEE